MASVCGSPVCAGGKPRLKFTYSGDYVVRKDGVVELLTSGTIVFLEPKVIDVFLVGGGGAGALRVASSSTDDRGFGGGGGGYTRTIRKINVAANDSFQVTVGAGGTPKTETVVNGNASGFGTQTVDGGRGGTVSSLTGGAGGSGGGGGVISDSDGGAGGSDGANGEAGYNNGGVGQGFTTREFGEASGKLYAGGGGGGRYMVSQTPIVSSGGSGGGGTGGWVGNGSSLFQPAAAGVANTGGGGGGGAKWSPSVVAQAGSGGAGIVCFREAQELPELAGTWVLHEKLYAPDTMPLTENVNFSSTNYAGGAASENDQCIFRTQYGVSYFEIHSASLSKTVTVYTFNTDSWTNKWTILTFPAGATASDAFRAWLASNATKQ